MAKIQLNESIKNLLSLVSQAAFANPFSSLRAELDYKILGITRADSWKKIVPQLIEHISGKIAELDRDGKVRISDFRRSDQEMIKYVFLFAIFHKYNYKFDDYITRQINAGSQPLKVSFADDVLKDFNDRGFSPESSRRYFALFYQIRRAFHFIDRNLIGTSRCMQNFRMHLWNNIFTHDISLFEDIMWNRMEDFSTLLIGPTGSGKGAAAAAIGQSGFIPFDEFKGCFAKNFTETFIPINLSQYAETLLESELFGHTKGAFTGAVSSRNGLFTLCGRHGSVFLDEIGEINHAIQIKLLKVLEERTFMPVGSFKPHRFQGRVIAATNQCLDTLRSDGRFRDDFYYRLCSDTIQVPSLKQRIMEDPDELKGLVQHTVVWITGQKSPDLCRLILDVIEKKIGRDYHWPGNVRELAQCVRSIIIKRDYTGDKKPVSTNPTRQLIHKISDGTATANELMQDYCRLLYDKLGTYEQVARITKLDRRTVKKYIQ